MKKGMIVLLVGLLLAVVVPSVYCDGPVEKLSRGLSNVVTAPCEIPHQIGWVNDNSGFAAAASYGIVKGVCMTGVRALVGVYEIATFPIPAPGNFEPILTDPEFFFDTKWK